jgi:hypothetical protein
MEIDFSELNNFTFVYKNNTNLSIGINEVH